MYKLYTRANTGGFVVEAALALAGVPFDQIDVPKSASPDQAFLDISPLNQVPVLILPDGSSMTESAAICILLAERHPEANLAPAANSPDRADFLRWMTFMSSVIYQADLRFFYAHRYTADPGGVDAVKQAAISEMDRGLAILDAALEGRDWLVGDQLSLADIYLVMLVAWHPEVGKVRTAWPNIERLWAKLREHQLMRKLNASHAMWPA
ncbi:MAG: glutathione S-transferase family protein [Mesorhizobium sp.]|uniref:glutathione S-transferase family protein n=2 Tax=Mesorhizobium TaxID=68287 RepID=UPI000FCA839E|nr:MULTISPECIES: glutathione S-transferase family protein [unclassified Mesorhizobium]RUV76128.1 glutathione S-transferase family protein [Mesorhizobium sp. M5C.F.Cr.IN.023.01.1.1]RWI42918.1 MAG: glutathione S-transferase family protein [Mesorhizobium sp.]RWI54186.1 MAG: glutathione S-transferase family protein [Mesorhizobium sp.]RWJ07939.1 MAG: glutathione S-transferase family protein [Mesorhizobium sp.]RWJ10736.1 MAG: glutathione S-transferase family protein [Mesorhizobium sp.]